MNLSFVPIAEIKRARRQVRDRFKLCEMLADIFRINTLYMITKAGSGHIGSSFSSLDIVTWLFTQEMKNPNEPDKKNSDIYFSSKGHDVPALYNVLIGTERLDFDYIHKLRRLDGLPGHPDIVTPYIMTNTGPLGMGISKAMGMAIAQRLDDKNGQIYVLTGDGELQEGAFWESLQPAANGSFGEITVIVDHNKIQSDTWIKNVSDLGDLEQKFRAFGWEVARCNGHDFNKLAQVFDRFKKVKTKPKILIADTKKGKGVKFMENVAGDGMYKFHSGAPDFETWQKAFSELADRVNKKLKSAGLGPLVFEEAVYEPKAVLKNPQKLISAYGDELVRIAKRRKDIVSLDVDLVLDTGLILFKSKFPKRHIECGIAEQHMVSVAGGLALEGKLPIVHSFACFLSTRPNEQIYNNSSEGKKIVYVGSLAGLLPGGPGHSHQSVRDVSVVGSIPNLTIIEPSCEQETRLALRWAVGENKGSSYLRLVSIPIEAPYRLPKGYKLRAGQGVDLVKGKDAVIIAYGPVMLTEAVKASMELKKEDISVAVINLPWLNNVNADWLKIVLTKYLLVLTVDDHYLQFGQGSLLRSKAVKARNNLPKIISLGLEEIPACGQNQEVLKYHHLDYLSISKTIKSNL